MKKLFLLIFSTLTLLTSAQTVGNSLSDQFTDDKASQYIPVSKEIKTEGGIFLYSFPPYSFTQIKIALKN
jgi:hypothetical protein